MAATARYSRSAIYHRTISVAKGGRRLTVNSTTSENSSAPWTRDKGGIPLEDLEITSVFSHRSSEWTTEVLSRTSQSIVVIRLSQARILSYSTVDIDPDSLVSAVATNTGFECKLTDSTSVYLEIDWKLGTSHVRKLEPKLRSRLGIEHPDWDVFISYPSPDRNFAKEIYKVLTEMNISGRPVKAWIDTEECKGQYSKRISEGLTRSASYIIVWSDNSLRWRGVQDPFYYNNPGFNQIDEITRISQLKQIHHERPVMAFCPQKERPSKSIPAIEDLEVSVELVDNNLLALADSCRELLNEVTIVREQFLTNRSAAFGEHP